MTTSAAQEPDPPDAPDDRSLAAAAASCLAKHLRRAGFGQVRLRTVDPDEPVREVRLPDSILGPVAEALRLAADGRSVSVIGREEELSSQQAADLLRVSRPYLITLLDAGEIDYRRVGTHRRIARRSLARYLDSPRGRQRRSADELIKLSEELGLYER